MPLPSNFNTSNSPLNLLLTTNESNDSGMGNYKDVSDNGAVQSLFGNNKFVVFPVGKDPITGDATSRTTNMHNDDVYDTSITSLIKFTDDPKLISMKLTAAHFAYLKDVGVFPNNRLMIARRFPAPVGNDLTAVTAQPVATLVSWVPEDSDFISMDVGEYWINAEGTFEKILDSTGKDTKLSDDNTGMSDLGKKKYKGGGLVPLPGLMEGIQREILKKLGITDDKDPTILPTGNPNLIKEAKQRKTIDKGEAGAGLKCDFAIKMIVEYEQKYINGIDSTLAYFDLLANVLSFATSESQFMYNKAYADGATGILGKLISGDISSVISSITKFVGEFIDVLKKQAEDIAKKIAEAAKSSKDKSGATATSITESLVKETLGAVIGKYKMAILGVISALTGMPSTPWHITIGNPKRPFFSSGDMYMEDVKLSMSPILAFNDLPSNIKVEFTLKNARALGAQEIFNRFNTGRTRSYMRGIPDIASADSNFTNNQPNASKIGQSAFGDTNISGDFLKGNGITTPIN